MVEYVGYYTKNNVTLLKINNITLFTA